MDGMGWTDEWPRNGDGDGAELSALNAREREGMLVERWIEGGSQRQGTAGHISASSWGLVRW